jgi:DNA-damage-inducible protein D
MAGCRGETAAMIAARKGLKRGQQILAHMGSTELAANLFRATQTEDKLRRKMQEHGAGSIGKAEANQTHRDMGTSVRQFILDQGGTSPEHLSTPTQSIQQLRHIAPQRIEMERQPTLFGADGEETDDHGSE